MFGGGGGCSQTGCSSRSSGCDSKYCLKNGSIQGNQREQGVSGPSMPASAETSPAESLFGGSNSAIGEGVGACVEGSSSSNVAAPVVNTTSSSPSSASSSCRWKCKKRSRCSRSGSSNAEHCPFSMLVDSLMSHAKRLCRMSNMITQGQDKKVMQAAICAAATLEKAKQASSFKLSFYSSASPTPEEYGSDTYPDEFGEFGGSVKDTQFSTQSTEVSGQAPEIMPSLPFQGNTPEDHQVSELSATDQEWDDGASFGSVSQNFVGAVSSPFNIPNSTDSAIQQLGSELSCSICTDLLLRASILCCGHSFCQQCINTWLRKDLSCPLCRNRLLKPPVSSITLDKAIHILLQSNPEKAQGYEKRKRKYEKTLAKEQEVKMRLEQMIEQAKNSGFKLVDISNPWSKREQQRFLQGVRAHSGEARVAYCKSVCFTKSFIASAQTSELVIAAANLRLRPPNGEKWEISHLRNRLLMYLLYG